MLKKLIFTFLLFLLITFGLNSQIVINEVHLKPQTSASAHSDQSLAHTTAGWGKEFIEIYNTSCNTVDIGCYVLSSESFGTSTRDGSYRFPSGTTIGPHAFISIGGAISGADINLSSLFSDPHMATGSTSRWYLDNGDCYVALFDDTGSPLDAVFWTTGSGESSKWATDSDLDDPVSQIPAPAACGVIGSFPDPSDANITAVVEYAGQSPSIGNSLARVQDGGGWTNTGTPSPSSTNGTFDPCSPLPVELIEFVASCKEASIQLEWSTATELDNDYFELQYTRDGYDYKIVGSVQGMGNSTTVSNYTYSLDIREYSKGYFRLKQVDFNGLYEYSPTVYMDCRNEEPFVDLVNGQIVVSNTKEIKNCMVYDMTGQLLFSGSDYQSFNATLSSSFYFIFIETGNGIFSFKKFNH